MSILPQKRAARAVCLSASVLALAGLALTLRAQTTHKYPTLPDVPRGTGQAVLLPNGWQVTPAGRAIPLPGDLPLGMTFSRDGRYLLVNTAGFHNHSLNVIAMTSEKIVQSVDVGKDFSGLCFGVNGSDLYLSGGGTPSRQFLDKAAKSGTSPESIAAYQLPVMRFAYADGALTPRPALAIPGVAGDQRFIGGLASGSDGSLYVVNIQNDTVYRLGGEPKTVQASAKVGRRPYAVALSRDGGTLAVTDWADAAVSLLDPQTLAERVRVPVGSRPNALVWGKDGRLFVACSGSNAVSVISGSRVTETVKTSLDPKAPVGSTPDALALAPNGKTLYVANADNNDVSVVDVADAKESRVLGFIPTGWYPSALGVSPDGRKLFVGVGKGLTFRPNADAQTHISSPQTLDHYDYIADCLSGVVSVVDVPNAKRLAAYTRQARANVPHPSLPDSHALNVRQARAGFSKIKHVVYVIRENRTYDQILGDMTEGNGDPKLCLFGARVTPNAHALARQYVLLDNLYCNGEVSEDGHQWCDSAYATDFTERAWPNSYSGRGEPKDNAGLGGSPAGYLWDNCARHGVSYRSYGEFSTFKSDPDTPPIFTGPKTLNGHANYAYAKIPWFGEPRDAGRADIFIQDLHAAEKTGGWPQFMVMALPEDHTQGLNAGAYTPTANVGENDLALGKIVQAVSLSKFWASTAIFVIEDDGQNGPDHVDAHRTVGLVISPYVRHGVDSTMYSTASFVRTMEIILGLPPMTQFDADATPLYNSFSGQPILTAYAARPAGVDLEARNPRTGPGAVASAKLDFSAPDQADPDALNAILWHALKPGLPQPAPVRSAFLLR